MANNEFIKRLRRISEYLTGNFKNIEGWCSPLVWQTIEPLVSFQIKRGFTGPIAEIGPYHGKFFWGLVETSGLESGHLAIDIFDIDTENKDMSGVLGDENIFLGHGRTSGYFEDSIDVLSRDSQELSSSQVMQELSIDRAIFNFFSVDGCHRKEFVLHDIQLAMELTHEEGVIILDDYGNPRWHGVQEAVSEIHYFQKPDFVPLAYSVNKLFLCHITKLESYRRYIQEYVCENFEETKVFEVERFGHLGLTILPSPSSTIHTSLGSKYQRGVEC